MEEGALIKSENTLCGSTHGIQWHLRRMSYKNCSGAPHHIFSCFYMYELTPLPSTINKVTYH